MPKRGHLPRARAQEEVTEARLSEAMASIEWSSLSRARAMAILSASATELLGPSDSP